MSKYLKQDIQDRINLVCKVIEKLQKDPSFAIGKEQIFMDRINQYNLRTAKLVESFKKLEETYKSMTKEEKKEYIRLVKIARKKTAAEFNETKK